MICDEHHAYPQRIAALEAELAAARALLAFLRADDDWYVDMRTILLTGGKEARAEYARLCAAYDATTTTGAADA